MGCNCCKEDSDDQPAVPAAQPPPQITAPTGGPQMVPPPYRDAHGQPITHQEHELDRATLIQALDHMGEYLDQQRTTAEVVTVGGAVNTILLRSRQSTHDVDFFMDSATSPQNNVIHEAARYAARTSSKRGGPQLGGNWFNNATQLFMSKGVQSSLARAAVEQGTIVHQHRGHQGGLIVYAAPWSYAFCGKLNRLCDPEPRPYDIHDAVVYLHEYLKTSKKQSVSKEEIFQWANEYGKNANQAVLDQVNNQYEQKYGKKVIT